MAEQLANIPIYILYIRLPDPVVFSFDQIILLLFLNIDVFIERRKILIFQKILISL